MEIEDLLIKSKAVQFGDFTLSSGAKSDVYIDCRKASMVSPFASFLGRMLSDNISRDRVLVGVPEGGIPLVALTLVHCAFYSQRGGWVRTKNKIHGTKGQLAGALYPGDSVIIIEDVVTTGKSVIEVISTLSMNNITVDYVLAIVDRYEKGNPFEAMDVGYQSLTTLSRIREREWS